MCIRDSPSDAPGEQRRAVHPGGVDVTVEEEDRPVRDDRVEVLLAGQTIREILHGPAATDHPRLVRMVGCKPGDGVEIGRAAGQVVEPDPKEIASGEGRCV